MRGRQIEHDDLICCHHPDSIPPTVHGPSKLLESASNGPQRPIDQLIALVQRALYDARRINSFPGRERIARADHGSMQPHFPGPTRHRFFDVKELGRPPRPVHRLYHGTGSTQRLF